MQLILGLYIRPLGVDSAHDLLGLRRVVDLEGTLGPPSERESALKLETVERMLEPPVETFGAHVEGQLIGTASIKRVTVGVGPDEVVYGLAAVLVHPEFRRRGVGRALVTRCLSRAVDLDAEEMLLLVNVPNPAKDLYDSLGFKEWHRHEGVYENNGQVMTQVAMRLVLPSKSGAEPATAQPS